MTYADPHLDCDIVMKGGITSGVVYPPAVTKLATEYRFHSVGGTSAGAIAAALTAAAELGRDRQPGDNGAGFDRLDTLSSFLAAPGNLMSLFQPQTGTKHLFGVLKSSLTGGPVSAFGRIPVAALTTWQGWLLVIAGILPGVGLATLLLPAMPDRDVKLWLLLSFLVAMLTVLILWGLTSALTKRRRLFAALVVLAGAGLVYATTRLDAPLAIWILTLAWMATVIGIWVGSAGGLAWSALSALPNNGYGLCIGGVEGGTTGDEPTPGQARRSPGPDAPLAVWLSEEIDLTADVVGEGRIVWQSDLSYLGVSQAPTDWDRPVKFHEASSMGIKVDDKKADDGLLRMGHLLGDMTDADLRRRPLLFGDLRAAGVNLQMLTTNLTHGRPYRLPLESRTNFNSNGFFFDPAQWRLYFPEYVVEWMEQNPPQRPPDTHERDWLEWNLLCAVLGDLRPLPDPDKLPVVVATRMSLSFPILISAVPLFSVDWSREVNIEARKAWRDWLEDNPEDWEEQLRGGHDDPVDADNIRWQLEPTLCWFSDGGISSNFPIHFFDAPLPRWPTFGLNLRDPHPDHPIVEQPPGGDESVNVWLPDSSSAGHHLRWTEIRGLVHFGRVIADTLQNWTDNAQLRVHGYWDRVTHISMGRDEGGMNLNMDPDLITRLGRRGEAAATALADRFRIDGPGPEAAAGWDYHRWLRYRSSMQLIEELMAKVRRGYTPPATGGVRSFETLISRTTGVPPKSYEFSAGQRQFAADQTRALVDLAGDWEVDQESFTEGAPAPSPELRITPPI